MTELHCTLAELEAGMDHVRASPREAGRLEMIVVRPAVNAREERRECEASPRGAIHGDRWTKGGRTAGSDVTLMSTRAADLVARDRSRWAMAGDQLYVDFDLSEDHLPPGTRIAVGEVEFEITSMDHTGCGKFAERFGRAALKFVNSPEGARLNLRGIYARVVRGGRLRTGDVVRKLPPEPMLL